MEARFPGREFVICYWHLDTVSWHPFGSTDLMLTMRIQRKKPFFLPLKRKKCNLGTQREVEGGLENVPEETWHPLLPFAVLLGSSQDSEKQKCYRSCTLLCWSPGCR